MLDRAFDKSKTLAYAEKLGMDIPQSLVCRNFEKIRKLEGRISYPVVLKFAESHLHDVPGNLMFKYRYVFSGKELLHCMEQYAPIGIYPIVQEYIPGKGVGVELCLYKGRVVGAFQHERIHEYPVAGGVSVYRKSVPLDRDLMDSSVRLLSAMDWGRRGHGGVSPGSRIRTIRVDGSQWTILGFFAPCAARGGQFSISFVPIHGRQRHSCAPAL